MKLFGRASRAVSRQEKLQTDDLERALSQIILESMVAAHSLADEFVASFARPVRASRISIDKLLKNATPVERKAIKKLYGSIAKSVTNRSMSHVREKLLGDVQSLIDSKKKGYREDVKDSLDKLGITKDSSSLVQTVTRTQAALAFNASAWSQFVANQDVWGFAYSTARDERVRASHAALDGVRYPKDHEFWNTAVPPNGWNCRCGLDPIFVWDEEASINESSGEPLIDTSFEFNAGKLFAPA